MHITGKHLDVRDLKTGLRILQTINLLGTIAGIWYIANTHEYYWIWVSLIGWFFIGHMGVIVAMHRLLSHRSFKTYLWIERMLTVLAIYGGAGSSLSFVASHRMHHHLSDKNADPYSPYIDGNFSLYKSLMILVGHMSMSNQLDGRYVKDMISDPFHIFIHNNYFKLLFIPMFLLLCYDPVIFVFACCIPSALTFQMMTWANILAHSSGYATYDTKDFSKNNWFVAIFTMGDGWHNNHHQYPRSYTTQMKWWEIDPLAWVIHLIKK